VSESNFFKPGQYFKLELTKNDTENLDLVVAEGFMVTKEELYFCHKVFIENRNLYKKSESS